MGFVAAPIESLPETSITDVYFTHERGTYMGWYAWTLASSNYLAPVLAGFINDGMGYKWPFFFAAIFAGISFLFLFFFMEETNYDRQSLSALNNDQNSPVVPSPADKKNDATSAGPAGEVKTFGQKLSIIHEPRPFLMHWRAWQILKLLSWPSIFFAGFSYGTYLIWFNVFNATASIVLGGEPYNFKPSIVGLSYLACIVGVTIGCVRISQWLYSSAYKTTGLYSAVDSLTGLR